MPPTYRTATSSVLVIGTGAAGLRAAIAATQAGVQARVLGKRPRLDAHTVLASGGINAALGTRDPEDSWEQHFGDTLREGYFLGNPRMVEIMARESPDAVRELAAWGCAFAQTEDGRLDQRFFGAHRWRRTCYAGDYTGRAILLTVADNLPDAFLFMYLFQAACKIQVRAQTTGAQLITIDPRIDRKSVV